MAEGTKVEIDGQFRVAGAAGAMGSAIAEMAAATGDMGVATVHGGGSNQPYPMRSMRVSGSGGACPGRQP